MTGGNYTEFNERLRDVESMISDPRLQADVQKVRDRARSARADFKRHTNSPNWELIRTSVHQPMIELQQRLAELAATETLGDLRNLPGARCHELTGDLKGCLAVDLQHPQRLIFEPDHDPCPVKPDGGLDWDQVKRVRILDIQDYH